MAGSPDMRTELPAFASFRQSGASCLSGLAITSREHLPGRAAGQGRAGACSRHHGTTRAWLVQTMSIRRLPHAAHRQRSCTSGVSPRPVAMRPCEVGVALVFAAPAGQQHADIAAAQRAPGRRQRVGHGDSIERAPPARGRYDPLRHAEGDRQAIPSIRWPSRTAMGIVVVSTGAPLGAYYVTSRR